MGAGEPTASDTAAPTPLVDIKLPMDADERRMLADALLRHVKNGSTDLAPSVVALDPDEYRNEELAQQERARIFFRDRAHRETLVPCFCDALLRRSFMVRETDSDAKRIQ